MAAGPLGRGAILLPDDSVLLAPIARDRLTGMRQQDVEMALVGDEDEAMRVAIAVQKERKRGLEEARPEDRLEQEERDDPGSEFPPSTARGATRAIRRPTLLEPIGGGPDHHRMSPSTASLAVEPASCNTSWIRASTCSRRYRGRAPRNGARSLALYALGLALVAAILFGAATPASKLLLGSLAPFQLAGLLYIGAMLGMVPLVAREGRGPLIPTLDPANFRRLATAIVLGGLVGPALLLIGLRASTAGSIALILNLEGVATAVLGVLFFREHLGSIGWLGVGGAVVATGLVAGGHDWPGTVGALFAAAACLCWAVDNHATALIDGLSAERSTLLKGLFAGTSQLAIGAVISPWTAPPATVLAALAVGALSYGVSISLYIRAAHRLGATRAQAVFASAPFIGAGLSILVLGERPPALHGVAALLLIASVAALFAGRHSHLHAHSSMRHTHSHRHDDAHHTHAHEPSSVPSSAGAEHVHEHVHEPMSHDHPHWPDLHHRHDHARRDVLRMK